MGVFGKPQRRLLVVEDDRDVRETLEWLLRDMGHEVESEADGLRAIETATQSSFDFALIDIGLPGLDGYDVAIEIRRRIGAKVRLVAMSGFGSREARQRSHEAGFDLHLTKPYDLERLRQLFSE
jgi:two-component system, sensor histidine kinase